MDGQARAGSRGRGRHAGRRQQAIVSDHRAAGLGAAAIDRGRRARGAAHRRASAGTTPPTSSSSARASPGLPAAITARDHGASVIVVEENFDIGGPRHAERRPRQLGGGHALQQKLDIKDNAEQVFLDWVRYDHGDSRYSDRDLVRVFADENVATWDFLIENGVKFIEKPIHVARCRDHSTHLRHQGMAHPERDHRAAPEPQRLRPGAPAGSRARARRARRSSEAQDDQHRARSATTAAGCSASPP